MLKLLPCKSGQNNADMSRWSTDRDFAQWQLQERHVKLAGKQTAADQQALKFNTLPTLHKAPYNY